MTIFFQKNCHDYIVFLDIISPFFKGYKVKNLGIIYLPRLPKVRKIGTQIHYKIMSVFFNKVVYFIVYFSANFWGKKRPSLYSIFKTTLKKIFCTIISTQVEFYPNENLILPYNTSFPEFDIPILTYNIRFFSVFYQKQDDETPTYYNSLYGMAQDPSTRSCHSA